MSRTNVMPVLVLVIAMWSQVDKSSRLLTPWSELELGRMSSLKLDYISPMLHVVIWRAARNRHIPVLVTASGSLLLKLIVSPTALGMSELINSGDSIHSPSRIATHTNNPRWSAIEYDRSLFPDRVPPIRSQ